MRLRKNECHGEDQHARSYQLTTQKEGIEDRGKSLFSLGTLGEVVSIGRGTGEIGSGSFFDSMRGMLELRIDRGLKVVFGTFMDIS